MPGNEPIKKPAKMQINANMQYSKARWNKITHATTAIIIPIKIGIRQKRFVWVEPEKRGLMKEVSVMVDTQTGVNYIFVEHCYGGFTALLD